MTNEFNYESLEPLFNPKSVAILGASEKPHKIGYLQLQALIDGKFAGDIFPIHPTAKEIAGRTSYATLADVPDDVDLVIFCLGLDQIRDGLRACAEKGVKSAIIFASGFSEAGEEGELLQQELGQLAKEYGIRIVGPNCVGLVNTSNGMIGTFSPSFLSVPLNGKKGVGYVSQSGAFGVLTYMAAAQQGVNFNYFISTGNEMESNLEDFVEYMVHDPQTSVISGYLEGSKNPEKLKNLALQALEKNKPMLFMKTGKSSAGSRAAASHTGSLAGSDKIYDAFFKQYGILRATDFDDIIAFAKLFNPERMPKGKNTVIITSSGGRGINEADRCESFGLNIIELSEATQQKIQQDLPSYASVTNPIDLTAAASVSNPEFYLTPMKALVEDPEVDNIIFTDFPYAWDENSEQLREFIDIVQNSDKFVALFPFPLNEFTYPRATQTLVENGIPVVPGSLNPVRALTMLVQHSERYQKWQKALPVEEAVFPSQPLDDLLVPGSTLSEAEASEVLTRYGIPTTTRFIANSAEEAEKYAEYIGYPVVLKIDSKDIPHKTEADAIRLNLTNAEEVRQAYEDVLQNAKNYKPDARIAGVSVQQMLGEGVEVIIGAHTDPTFGPVIMAGLGGIFVEVFQDVAFKVAPLSRLDVLEAIEELRGKAILHGSRGKSPLDTEAIIDVMLKVSKLIMDYKDDIQELDINPLMVYEKGIIAADAMLVVKEKSSTRQTTGG